MSKSLLDVNQYEEIDKILKKHDMNKHNLVGILADVQDLSPEHYITKEQAEYISERLGIFLSNVYDTITFYSTLPSNSFDNSIAHFSAHPYLVA
jgi:NADH:ubiquinone oxidoreductase subunit E